MQEPKLSRKDVASILNCTPLTISNREKTGKYPPPSRDLNNYRVYSLKDVINLQRITYGRVNYNTIISVLFDKGYKNMKEVGKLIDSIDAVMKGAAS